VVGQQNSDIADTLQLRTLPWQTFLTFYTGCTLAPTGKYDWTVHVRQR